MRTILVVGSNTESRAMLRFLWLFDVAGLWTVMSAENLQLPISDSFIAFLGDRDALVSRWRGLILGLPVRRTPCWVINPLEGVISKVLNGTVVAPACWDLTLLAVDQELHDWGNSIPQNCNDARAELEVILRDIVTPLIELGALSTDQVATLRGCCAERAQGPRWRRMAIDEVQHIRTLLGQARR